jgi:uncharacterized protein with ParB-like and HNH nuclease domain
MINTVNKYPINEIFKKNSSFYYKIPKYQREYTWSYNEWYSLYNDIMENSEGYFIGSIICINNGDSNYPILEVIDGQQRLTTICLLLATLYDKLNKQVDMIPEDDRDILSDISKSLKCKVSKDNGLALVPQVQNNNFEDFNYTMYELGILDYAAKPSKWGLRKMGRARRYFNELIDRDITVNPQDKINVLMDIVNKVFNAMLVKIEVSSHSDAYILFESLNNRGLPLTSIELMKNLIMARAEKCGLTVDDCYKRWQSLLGYLTDNYQTQERFFRQYYNAFKYELNKPFRTENKKSKEPLGYVATKSNLLSIYESLINYNLPNFLNEIVTCGEIYSQFIDTNKTRQEWRKPLLDLMHIQAAPSYLLLLYLLKKQEALKIDDNCIKEIIELLVIYFVRRNVTDFPGTRDMTRIFMEITEHIETEVLTGINLFSFIKQSLKDNVADDERFSRSLQGDLYKENTGAARYLLCALAEKYMTKETWIDLWARSESSYKYIWTIEHIFPEGDNIPQEWVDMIANGDKKLAEDYRVQYVHKLGNMTITGYNSALSNMAFDKKRDRKSKNGKHFIGYKNGLEINSEIAERDSWTIEDIKERTNKLVSELLVMFKFPE